MTALVLVQTVLLAVLAVLVAGLLRAYGTVLRRLHRLDGGADAAARDAGPRAFTLTPAAAGRAARRSAVEPPSLGPAHDVSGETLGGELVTARVARVEHDTLLLFLSSGCASCAEFWADLATPGTIHLPPGVRLLVVPQGASEESPTALTDLAPDGVDVICSTQAWRDYGVPGSPHAVYVDGPSGRIRGEGTGQSLRQVAALVARATGDASFLTGGPSPKPRRDSEQEAEVDRELLAAGILPGDPRLYGQPS